MTRGLAQWVVPSANTKRVPIPQVARDLGIPRSLVDYWVRNGELDTIRFGRQGWLLVRPDDVRALVTGTPPSGKVVATYNSLPASSFSRR